MARSPESHDSGVYQLAAYSGLIGLALGAIFTLAAETKINHSGQSPEPTPGPTMLQIPLLDCDGNVRSLAHEFPLVDGAEPILIGDASLVRRGDIMSMAALIPGQQTIVNQNGTAISYSPKPGENYVVSPRELGNNKVGLTGECLPKVTQTP